MIKALSERLSEGGVLLFVDWVSSPESGFPPFTTPKDSAVKHEVAHLGFGKSELDKWFKDAGLGCFDWKWVINKASCRCFS